MSIRQVGPADLPAIAAVEAAAMASPWSVEQLAAELQHPAGLLLAALQDGQPVGYVDFRTVLSETELLRLVVLPDRQRQGMARSLLESGLVLLADQGVQTCFLEVRSGNTPARLLYAQYGFVKVGTRPNYYRDPGEDAVLMRYDLNGHRRKDEDNSGS